MNVAMTTGREVLRHVLYRIGGYGLVTGRRTRKGSTAAHLDRSGLKDRFAAIYELGVWRHNDQTVPGSGAGSTLEASAELRRTLPALLKDLNTKTLLDVGCGDFTWMQHVAIEAGYIGVDVVDAVIRTNREKFEETGRRFISADATMDDLPEADVVLCRHVLFHLSFSDIRKFFKNLLSKERSFLIITSDRQTVFNADIPTGDYRLLNLEAWPFWFQSPDRVVPDSSGWPRRIIGVWRADRIRERMK